MPVGVVIPFLGTFVPTSSSLLILTSEDGSISSSPQILKENWKAINDQEISSYTTSECFAEAYYSGLQCPCNIWLAECQWV